MSSKPPSRAGRAVSAAKVPGDPPALASVTKLPGVPDQPPTPPEAGQAIRRVRAGDSMSDRDRLMVLLSGSMGSAHMVQLLSSGNYAKEVVLRSLEINARMADLLRQTGELPGELEPTLKHLEQLSAELELFVGQSIEAARDGVAAMEQLRADMVATTNRMESAMRSREIAIQDRHAAAQAALSAMIEELKALRADLDKRIEKRLGPGGDLGEAIVSRILKGIVSPISGLGARIDGSTTKTVSAFERLGGQLKEGDKAILGVVRPASKRLSLIERLGIAVLVSSLITMLLTAASLFTR